MRKKLTLTVPKYLRKFLEVEFGGSGGVVPVEKSSELGRMIHLVSRTFPFPVALVKQTGSTVTLTYHCREKAFEVPAEKYPELVRQMDELFRRTMICEVRGIHEMAGGDYSTYIRRFLGRYDIAADDDGISWETIRKVYRDYLARVERKNAKNIFA